MTKRLTKEQYIINKIVEHLDIIKSDLQDGRHISAIISGIGLIYSDEHEIAHKYLKEIGVLNER